MNGVVQRVAAWLVVSVVLLSAVGAATSVAARHRRTKPPVRQAAVPRLGQVGALPAPDTWKLGIFEPLGRDMQITDTYYGLHHTDTWLDLFVRTASGEQYVTAQHLTQATCTDTLVSLFAGYDAQCGVGPVVKEGGFNIGLMSQPLGLAMAPNPLWRSWVGHPTQTLLPDDEVQWSIPDPFSQESLIYGAGAFAWTSADGAIDLTGSLVAPGSWYYLPTPREAGAATSNSYYDNAYYRVSGMYSGQRVSGYIIIENMWGNVPYDETWWLHHRQSNWTAFTTTYSNGLTEYGQFFCGAYGARGAVISNNLGQLVARTYKVNADLEAKDPLGTPMSYRYVFPDGQQWQYTGDPKATILPGGSSLSLGTVTPVGSKLKVVSASAVQLTDGKWCAPESL